MIEMTDLKNNVVNNDEIVDNHVNHHDSHVNADHADHAVEAPHSHSHPHHHRHSHTIGTLASKVTYIFLLSFFLSFFLSFCV